MRNIRTAEKIRAGGKRVEQTENVHERGFSRTGRPGNGNIVAGRDMKIDAAQRGDTAAIIYFTRRNEF